MLWAKPVWGIWWTWDARLTSFFVLWLIYWGYLMLRRLVESPEQRARLSAVFGVLGAVDVPIIYVSNRVWRTQHPQPVIGGGEGSGLDPRMGWTLGGRRFWLLHLLFFYLWKLRQDLERAQEVGGVAAAPGSDSRGLHEFSFCFIHARLAFVVRLRHEHRASAEESSGRSGSNPGMDGPAEEIALSETQIQLAPSRAAFLRLLL